jgi:hypothetical protein
MYCGTFTPNFFAGAMWPSSCNAIDKSKPIAKIDIPSKVSM